MAGQQALLIQHQNPCLITWIPDGGDALKFHVAIDVQIEKQDAVAFVAISATFSQKGTESARTLSTAIPKTSASSSSAAMRRLVPRK
ncbi:hypothetical protein [Mesorhizobium sp. B2-6-5]|uniref:hypothetical protein n=1 Tax=Mesorhizobium sp. B2-6-5 TaxID=2589912 RepID=UPI0015E39C9D|nr:hypothetical protein [Mesorhizobium sp. B2-6-5]